MWSLVVAIARALIPPSDADPVAIQRHRLATSLGLIVLTMAVGTHIALACGFFASTFIGFQGFAKADAVSEVAREVQQIEIAQFDSKILQDRERQCKLAQTNSDAREMMAQRIEWELQTYKKLSGNDYVLPSCDQF